MSDTIYTYNLHESLSQIFDLEFKEIFELSDQKMFESTNIKHDGTVVPWNKGKKGLQESCWKGKTLSTEHKRKLSEYRSGKTYEELYGLEEAKKQKFLRSEHNTGSGNPMWGKQHTEETKRLIGKLATGRKTGRTSETFTDSWKQNISKGVSNQKQHSCPHCSKTMFAGNYTRWHGDKCKRKEWK